MTCFVLMPVWRSYLIWIHFRYIALFCLVAWSVVLCQGISLVISFSVLYNLDICHCFSYILCRLLSAIGGLSDWIFLSCADMRQLSCLAQWSAHEGEVLSVQFSSDETSCFSMGCDGKVRNTHTMCSLCEKT